jgi:hypothetical protein
LYTDVNGCFCLIESYFANVNSPSAGPTFACRLQKLAKKPRRPRNYVMS